MGASCTAEEAGEKQLRRSHDLVTRGTVDLWKWIAGALLMVIVAMGGYLGHSGITSSEAEKLISGPTNPYVQDKSALDQRLNNIETKLSDTQHSVDGLQKSINKMCIKLGVDPDGAEVVYRQRKGRAE